jgi:GDP-D-mannose dehydratase
VIDMTTLPSIVSESTTGDPYIVREERFFGPADVAVLIGDATMLVALRLM